ncbi:MAG: (d)CMP kinase [Tetrasphaera sp.]
MSRPLVIAIDGPSGSGKSSVSKAIARHFGIGYLDTGAMYRAVTVWCQRQGIDLGDQAAVAAAADDLPLALGADPNDASVELDGEDVSEVIRSSAVSAVVSAVATNLDVRAILQGQQRALIEAIGEDWGGVVAEGRDITTVVAPDADVRVLLTASEAARLARRSTELHGRADDDTVAATHDEIVRRDRDDATVSEFQVAADGVVTLDTSALSFAQSVAAVIAVVEARQHNVEDPR